MLAANVLKGCEVTVGSDKEGDSQWPYAGTAGAIQSMGSTHVCKGVSVSFFDLNLIGKKQRQFNRNFV